MSAHPHLDAALQRTDGATLAVTSFERGTFVATLHFPAHPANDLYLKGPSIESVLDEMEFTLANPNFRRTPPARPATGT